MALSKFLESLSSLGNSCMVNVFLVQCGSTVLLRIIIILLITQRHQPPLLFLRLHHHHNTINFKQHTSILELVASTTDPSKATAFMFEACFGTLTAVSTLVSGSTEN